MIRTPRQMSDSGKEIKKKCYFKQRLMKIYLQVYSTFQHFGRPVQIISTSGSPNVETIKRALRKTRTRTTKKANKKKNKRQTNNVSN